MGTANSIPILDRVPPQNSIGSNDIVRCQRGDGTEYLLAKNNTSFMKFVRLLSYTMNIHDEVVCEGDDDYELDLISDTDDDMFVEKQDEEAGAQFQYNIRNRISSQKPPSTTEIPGQSNQTLDVEDTEDWYEVKDPYFLDLFYMNNALHGVDGSLVSMLEKGGFENNGECQVDVAKLVRERFDMSFKYHVQAQLLREISEKIGVNILKLLESAPSITDKNNVNDKVALTEGIIANTNELLGLTREMKKMEKIFVGSKRT